MREERGDGEPLRVELEHSRWRHFAWALLFAVLGAFLLFRVGGTIAKILGVGVLLWGGRSIKHFIVTYVRPAGTIMLRASELVLPPRLHAAPLTLPLGEVKHAYLLRRAVPWTTAGPLLVVETGRGTFHYPRDWFAAESDQRRVVSAVGRKIGRI